MMIFDLEGRARSVPLRQIQRSTNRNRQLAIHALEMVFLDARNSFGDEVGHDAVDRPAIITAVSHDGLERGDIGRVAQQFVPRFEVIIKARAGTRKIIGFIHVRRLMEPTPFIARRERIYGMKKRIVIGSANANRRKGGGENDKSDSAEAMDNHRNNES
jgi:hypothetical protein